MNNKLSSSGDTPQLTARVWDLPTRLFHWGLLICIIGAFASVKAAQKWGPDAMQWHFYCGYAILTLLLFRIIWGFVGNRYARFSSFLPNPLAAWRTLRGAAASHLGHNALGAWSVYGLLCALSFQAVTGLMSNDDIVNEGPWVIKISKSLSDSITGFHKLNEKVIIGLVLLHIAAIVYYKRVKKEPLTRARVVGDKIVHNQLDVSSLSAMDDAPLRFRALVVFVCSAATVWVLVNKAPAWI